MRIRRILTMLTSPRSPAGLRSGRVAFGCEGGSGLRLFETTAPGERPGRQLLTLHGVGYAVQTLRSSQPGTPAALRWATPHPLHHLAHLLVVLHQPIHVLHGRARAACDPPPTAGVEQLGAGPLALGHAGDDRLDAADLALVHLRAVGNQLVRAGDHAEDVRERAHLLELAHLHQHVLQGEVAEVLEVALVLVLALERLGLLDQREHVAHAEDPAGDAVGAERLEPVETLADAGAVDRLAGDVLGRQRGAATGVAVHLAHHQAGHADPLVERGRHR